jgi:hypothetical protein
MKRAKLYPFISILILVLLFTTSAASSQCSLVKEGQEGVTKESPQGPEITGQAQSGQEGVTKESPQGQETTKETPLGRETASLEQADQTIHSGSGENAELTQQDGTTIIKSADEFLNIIQNANNKEITWAGNILIEGSVIIPEGATLIIEPGTVVEFKHWRDYKSNNKVGINVFGGTIKAIGTPEKQIIFTSDADEPINGDWSGIIINNSINSQFDYVVVEFGEIGISQINSSATISNSIIRWNNSEGLYAERSKPTFEYNTLYGNAYHEIALEQYNDDVKILYNVFRDGRCGAHFEKTTAYLEGNYFVNYPYAITGGMDSEINVVKNKFENIQENPPIIDVEDFKVTISGCDFGDGSVQIPKFEYQDIKNYDLGYIPGDPQDKYPYIYSSEDETRKVIKKIGKGLGFGWSLLYAQDNLWRFTIGNPIDFIKIDPNTDTYVRYENTEIMNPRGLAYDGEYFWVNDFSLLKIFKFKLTSNSIQIIDSYDIPEKEIGGTSGLTSDGNFLYLLSRDGMKLYKLDKECKLAGEIILENGPAHNALVWADGYFWSAGGSKGIGKWTKDGKLVGGIYPPAGGTWALAWDGKYLWTLQRTCEAWDDPKIFQVEILDDSSL